MLIRKKFTYLYEEDFNQAKEIFKYNNKIFEIPIINTENELMYVVRRTPLKKDFSWNKLNLYEQEIKTIMKFFECKTLLLISNEKHINIKIKHFIMQPSNIYYNIKKNYNDVLIICLSPEVADFVNEILDCGFTIVLEDFLEFLESCNGDVEAVIKKRLNVIATLYKSIGSKKNISKYLSEPFVRIDKCNINIIDGRKIYNKDDIEIYINFTSERGFVENIYSIDFLPFLISGKLPIFNSRLLDSGSLYFDIQKNIIPVLKKGGGGHMSQMNIQLLHT